MAREQNIPMPLFPWDGQNKSTLLHSVDSSVEEEHEYIKHYFLEKSSQKAVLLFVSKGSTPIN